MLLRAHLSAVINALVDRIGDAEPSVRVELPPFVAALAAAVPAAALPRLARTFGIYASAALSRSQTSVRLDAAALVAALIEAAPTTAITLEPLLLDSLVGLLEPALHTLVSVSHVVAAVPACYNLGVVTATTHTSTRQRLTGVEGRIAAAFVLRRLLLMGDESHEGDSARIGSVAQVPTVAVAGAQQPIADAAATPLLQCTWTPSPAMAVALVPAVWQQGTAAAALAAPLGELLHLQQNGPCSSQTAAASTTSVSSRLLSAPLVLEALRQLVSLWLECAPHEAHNDAAAGTTAGNAAIARLALVARTIGLVWMRSSCSSSNSASGRASDDAADAVARVAELAPRPHESGGVADAVSSLRALGVAAEEATAANATSTRVSSEHCRLIIATIRAHVLSVFPIVPSTMLGERAAAPSAAAPSAAAPSAAASAAAPAAASAAAPEQEARPRLALLNLRLAELATALLPTVSAVQRAEVHLEGVAGNHDVNKRTRETSAARNPFELPNDTPAPRAAPIAAVVEPLPLPAGVETVGLGGFSRGGRRKRARYAANGSARNTEANGNAAGSIVECIPQKQRSLPAPPRGVNNGGSTPKPAPALRELKRGMQAYIELRDAALAHVLRTLQSLLLSAQAMGGGFRRARNQSIALDEQQITEAVAAGTLELLRNLLPHAPRSGPHAAVTLLEGFSNVMMMSAPRSSTRRVCAALACELLAARRRLDDHAAVAVAPAVAAEWLRSFPKLLWALDGDSSATSLVEAVVAAILDEARAAGTWSDA